MIKPIHSIFLFMFFTNSCYGQNKTDSVIDNDKTKSSQAPGLSKGKSKSMLFQSSDHGNTWQDISSGLPENLQVTCAFAQDGEFFLGSQHCTLYHSSNTKTVTWEKEVVSQDFPTAMITSIFHGHSGPYVCISQGGFFRKKTGTSIWEPMGSALKDKTVHAVLENADGTIFIACPSGIYKSEDDCKTWKHVFADDWVTSLASIDNFLVCSGSKGLSRSDDGGENWECVLNDKGGVYNTKVINGQFAATRVAGPWLAPVRDVPQRTFTSPDHGKTWERLDGGLPQDHRIYDLEEEGEYLFCSHKIGVSRSVDGGKNWELMSTSAISGEQERFELVVSGQIVFAVIITSGC